MYVFADIQDNVYSNELRGISSALDNISFIGYTKYRGLKGKKIEKVI